MNLGLKVPTSPRPHPGPLPPKGGEGACSFTIHGRAKAVKVTMNLEFEDADRASPSPLNGERAGVRGENGLAHSLWFMVPMRVQKLEVEALHEPGNS